MTFIAIKNLTKEFDLSTGKITAVNDVSMSIEKGQFIGIYGVSGSGKTTLLNLIGLLDSPSGGELIIDGNDITSYDENARAKNRNEFFGFLHQSFGLLSDFTAFENVELPLLIQDIDEKERQERCVKALQSVGLEAKKESFPFQLSGGQQQRIALARAMVTNPQVILTDEPTGALDTLTGRQIVQMLREVAHNNEVTVIMVTHDRSYREMFDTVYTMNAGEVFGEKTP